MVHHNLKEINDRETNQTHHTRKSRAPGIPGQWPVGFARASPGSACHGRPARCRTSLTVYEGMTGMLENAFINVKNRSKSITATLLVNGQKVAAGRIEHTVPLVFSGDEG
jgi:hypothetical protein